MRRRVPSLLVNLGATLILLGTFLAWVRVGERSRSSYQLADILRRLELAPDGAAAWIVRCWPLIPLLVVAAVVAGWWQRPRWSGALGVISAAYAGGVASIVIASPVPVRLGVPATIVGAAALAVGSIGELVLATRFAAPGTTR